MKLVFPNGEHPSVLLSMGMNRIGSDPAGAVVLALPGVASKHLEIHVSAGGAHLQLPDGAGAVSVNGKPVTALLALRSGDQLGFGGVVVKVVATAAAPAVPHDDAGVGATRVRAVAPKFILRGVSGAIFGKVFPVAGPTTIGRSAECDISIDVEEISRRHATVRPKPDGLEVEDLGSANGTFINNKRVQTGPLRPGDELRLDQVRFLLVAPGTEIQQAQQRGTPAPDTAKAEGGGWMRPLAVAVILASAAFIAWVLFAP